MQVNIDVLDPQQIVISLMSEIFPQHLRTLESAELQPGNT